MKRTFIFLLFLASLASCKTQQYAVKVPDCIDVEIRRIQAEAPAKPPLEVWQWKVGEEVFYYITAPCCDQFTTLMNSNCELGMAARKAPLAPRARASAISCPPGISGMMWTARSNSSLSSQCRM